MKYKYYLKSDIGIVRKQNQDSGFAYTASVPTGQAFFGGVCDGMGGMADGEIASGYVAARLHSWFSECFPAISVCQELGAELFRQWGELINECSGAIAEMGQSNNAPSGTTLSLLLIFNGRFYAAQIGDSRIYSCSDGSFVQVTKDHSYVHDMVDKGLMTDDEAVSSTQRNILTRCIGYTDNVQADYYIGTVKKGDWFLVSSDGFHGGTEPAELFSMLGGKNKLTAQKLRARVRAAIERRKTQGERDNITALAVVAS